MKSTLAHTRYWLPIVLLCLSVNILVCQDRVESAPAESDVLTEGTWINMRFIEHVKAHKSVSAAMRILRPNELLVLRAVRQPDSVLLFYASRSLDEGQPTDVHVKAYKGLGDQRRLSAFGQTWILGISKAKSEYIALHSTVDSNAKPDVFAVIPSKNQDASFIYQRVLNSATLTGTYRDAAGKTLTFTRLQHATTPNGEFEYRIVVVPNKPYQILDVVSSSAKHRRYAYEWKGETLVISTIGKKGALKPLYKLKKQA